MEDTRIDYGMSKDGIEAYTYIRTDSNKNVYILSCIKSKCGKKHQYKGKEYKNLFNAVKASRKFVHDTIFNSNNNK
jgi:hypothetical protein